MKLGAAADNGIDDVLVLLMLTLNHSLWCFIPYRNQPFDLHANQMTGFCMKWNTGLKWFKKRSHVALLFLLKAFLIRLKYI